MYSLFRDLAIIILSAKFFGLLARKCKAPQVVGEIIAGLLIGPCLLNLVQISDSISIFAEIGVVMLMFTTGLGTNLKELIKANETKTLKSTLDTWDATKAANAIAEAGSILPVVDNVEDIDPYTASVGEAK